MSKPKLSTNTFLADSIESTKHVAKPLAVKAAATLSQRTNERANEITK